MLNQVTSFLFSEIKHIYTHFSIGSLSGALVPQLQYITTGQQTIPF